MGEFFSGNVLMLVLAAALAFGGAPARGQSIVGESTYEDNFLHTPPDASPKGEADGGTASGETATRATPTPATSPPAPPPDDRRARNRD